VEQTEKLVYGINSTVKKQGKDVSDLLSQG
jgi:hypothetical protein